MKEKVGLTEVGKLTHKPKIIKGNGISDDKNQNCQRKKNLVDEHLKDVDGS